MDDDDEPGARVLATIAAGADRAAALCARLLAPCRAPGAFPATAAAVARDVAAVRALVGAAPPAVRAAAAGLLLDFALAPEADFCLRPAPVCAARVDRLCAAAPPAAPPAALARAWRAFAGTYPPAAHAASPAAALSLPFPQPRVPACAVHIYNSDQQQQQQQQATTEDKDKNHEKDKDNEDEEEEEEEDSVWGDMQEEEEEEMDDDDDDENALGTLLTVSRSGAVAVDTGCGRRLTPPPRFRYTAALRTAAPHNCALLAAAFAALVQDEGDGEKGEWRVADVAAAMLLRRVAPAVGAVPDAGAYAAVLPRPTAFACDARAQRLFAQNPVLLALLDAVLAARPRVRCAAGLARPLVCLLAGCVAEWHACPAAACPPALLARTRTLLRLLVRARAVPPPLAAVALVLPARPGAPLGPLGARDLAAALRAFLVHCAGGATAAAAAAAVRAVLLRRPCAATLPLLALFSGTVLRPA